MDLSDNQMMMLGLVFLADTAAPGSCSCDRHDPVEYDNPENARQTLSVSIPDCSCFPDPITVYIDGQNGSKDRYQSEFSCRSKSQLTISVNDGPHTVKAKNINGSWISKNVDLSDGGDERVYLECPKSNTDRCYNSSCSSSYPTDNSCANSSCVSCPTVTDNTFYVDPLYGNDATGTGNNSARCRFKTIRRALDAVGVRPGLETRVLVLAQGTVGGSGGNGDTFPITVPANVAIGGVGSSGSGAANASVVVSPNADGFLMVSPNSVLENLDISGQKSSGSGMASCGVQVHGGSNNGTAIRRVAVHDFSSDGIRVSEGGILTIGQGVTSTKNGFSSGGTTATGNGLYVGGTGSDISGKVTIEVASGSEPIRFDNNAANGIQIDGYGSVIIVSSVETTIPNAVSTSGNGGTGVLIEQAARGSNPLPVNEIGGLVSKRNGEDGIRVYGGSALKLRGSVILANHGNGVMVKSNSQGPYDVSQIDLGKTGDWGANTLQSSTVTDQNGAAGICLMFYVHADPVTLNAAGNTFSALEESNGPIDCATTATMPVLKTSNDCTGAVDISVYALAGSPHLIDVSNCRDSLGE